MEFHANRTALLEKFNTVAGAISPNSPVAELSGILLEAFDDHLQITGSGTDLSIQTLMYPGELTGLNIQEPGSIILDSRLLIELLRKLDGDSVKIETMDHSMARISNDGGDFTLLGKPGNTYPDIDLTRPDTHIILTGKQIHEMVSELSYACAEKETRLVLTGVHMRCRDGIVQCVATDSYRLAMKTLDLNPEEEFKVTIPKRSLLEAAKNLPENTEEPIDIYIGRKTIQFVIDKTLIQSQVYEGTFPEVQRSIPAQFTTRIEIEPHGLIKMLDRACLYKEDKPVCSITCDGKELRITAKNDTIGNSEQSFYDFTFEGQPISMIINGVFMLQALKAIPAEKTVVMEFKDGFSPVKITNPEDDSVVMVVVPLRAGA